MSELCGGCVSYQGFWIQRDKTSTLVCHAPVYPPHAATSARCRQKQPLTLQNPGGKGGCDGGTWQLPTETLLSALSWWQETELVRSSAVLRSSSPRPRSPPPRQRRPADRDREGEGRPAPSCHVTEPLRTLVGTYLLRPWTPPGPGRPSSRCAS